MKTKLILTGLFGILSLAFVFRDSFNDQNNSSATEVTGSNISDNFIIGAMQTGIDNSYSNLDTLGLNLWHKYSGGEYEPSLNRQVPTGWTAHDKLLADSSLYVSEVQGKLYEIYSHNNRRSLMQRPKIEWLCFGQRSDYQAEDTSHLPATSDGLHDLWFYSFQSPNHIGIDTLDSGKYVRKCRVGVDAAETVVSRLRANTEQCQRDTIEGGWWADTFCNWHIKPRVRIDSAFVQNNPQADVFRIKVFAQNGTTVLLDDTIRASYFQLNAANLYRGQYIEEFFLPPGKSLKITTHWGDQWGYKARGNRTTDTDNNKADIQIYWFGNCDMWLDYVRVDNDVADRLLKPGGDLEYEKWLRWEARDIACYNDGLSPLKFYIELSEFNNIPCISYVSNKLKQYTQQYCGKTVNMMTDLTNTYSAHVPWEDKTRFSSLLSLPHLKNNFNLVKIQ